MSRAPVGLLGINLGGPRTLDDVAPFLERLFADREIIRLPGGRPGQRLVARWIVRRRLPAVRRHYAAIGGGSPIYRYTAAQLAGAAQRLSAASGTPVRPYIAFRYTEPSADTAVRAMAEDGVEEAIVLSLYPQYSTATTGSSLRELGRALARAGLAGRFRFHLVDRWAEQPDYIGLLASRIDRALQQWTPARRAGVVLVFSAHSLPLSFVRQGDPYPAEVAATVRAVLRELGPRAPARWVLAYQSQTGPVRWLGPRTDRVLERLGREGVTDVLLVPLSFVSDHIETLYEIDQLFAHTARRAGIGTFRRTESLNDDPAFLDALAQIAAASWQRPPVAAAALCGSA